MEVRLYKIAGFTISIRFQKTTFPNYEALFKKQLTQAYQGFAVENTHAPIDFTIDVMEKENLDTLIQSKQKKKYYVHYYEEIDKSHGRTFYYISQIQFEFIIRTVLHALLEKHNGYLLHASGSKIHNTAYLFLATAGGGKSTIARMFSQVFPRIADDTVVIKKEKDFFYVYKTPLRERRPFMEKTSDKLPLGKIFFLSKTENHAIVKLHKKDAILKNFIKQGFFLNTQELEKKLPWAMNFVHSWDDFYQLSFSLNNFNRMVELIRK